MKGFYKVPKQRAFVTQKEFGRHERQIKEALRLASTHDPDLLKRIEFLERQVNFLMER